MTEQRNELDAITTRIRNLTAATTGAVICLSAACVVLFIVAAVCKNSDESRFATIGQQITDCDAMALKLEPRIDRLEKLQGHPFVRILTADKGAEQPDLNAALGHALMAVQDIFGHDAVIKHFRDMTGSIVAKRIPVDVGGAIKAKCEDDAEQEINKLLSQ